MTNIGSDRAQLANIASRARDILSVEKLEKVADRAYYSGEEILACDKVGIAVTLPKPMTSDIGGTGSLWQAGLRLSRRRDAYRCPAGEKLTYHYTNEEGGQQLRRYWTNACRDCALKASCTIGKERRITRWEHEDVLEEVQRRLDHKPQGNAVASGDSRTSIRHDEGPHGSDALPDQNTSKSSR